MWIIFVDDCFGGCCSDEHTFEEIIILLYGSRLQLKYTITYTFYSLETEHPLYYFGDWYDGEFYFMMYNRFWFHNTRRTASNFIFLWGQGERWWWWGSYYYAFTADFPEVIESIRCFSSICLRILQQNLYLIKYLYCIGCASGMDYAPYRKASYIDDTLPSTGSNESYTVPLHYHRFDVPCDTINHIDIRRNNTKTMLQID